ncbi:MAG: DUF6747 family protein [Chitinophagaceae bacterium]
MNTILLVKDIYLEGFRYLGAFIVRNFFKGYAWFCFALMAIAFYALIFRMSTGYAFY